MSATKRAAIFFDRDNTLVVSDGYLGDPEKVVLVDGAADAVARARRLGFATVVFSNQSGVARGLFDEDAVRAVNARMEQLLLEQNPGAVIDRHEYCPFHPEALVEEYRKDSDLRKPKPGMILEAAGRLALDLTRSWVVGDAPRDVEAGHAAGCRTILVRHPHLPPSPAARSAWSVLPNFEVDTLKEALDAVERDFAPVAPPPTQSEVISHDPPQDRSEPAPAEVAAGRAHEEVVNFEPMPDAGAAPVQLSRELAASEVQTGGGTEQAEQTTAAAAPVTAAPPARPWLNHIAERRAAASTPDEDTSGAAGKPIPVAGKATTMAILQAAAAKKAGGGRESNGGADAASPPPAESIATTESPEPLTAAPAADESSATSPRAARLETLAEQILQELRRRNEQDPGDFSVTKLLAGIVQVMALAALLMAYMRWETDHLIPILLVALFLQMLTISLLIMGRQSL